MQGEGPDPIGLGGNAQDLIVNIIGMVVFAALFVTDRKAGADTLPQITSPSLRLP